MGQWPARASRRNPAPWACRGRPGKSRRRLPWRLLLSPGRTAAPRGGPRHQSRDPSRARGQRSGGPGIRMPGPRRGRMSALRQGGNPWPRYLPSGSDLQFGNDERSARPVLHRTGPGKPGGHRSAPRRPAGWRRRYRRQSGGWRSRPGGQAPPAGRPRVAARGPCRAPFRHLLPSGFPAARTGNPAWQAPFLVGLRRDVRRQTFHVRPPLHGQIKNVFLVICNVFLVCTLAVGQSFKNYKKTLQSIKKLLRHRACGFADLPLSRPGATSSWTLLCVTRETAAGRDDRSRRVRSAPRRSAVRLPVRN
jgi:hypothetical protein